MLLRVPVSVPRLRGMDASQSGRREEEAPLRFGTSGIRGVVGEGLTEDDCECAGRALGTLLGQGARVCLARDTRHSGPAVTEWVVRGLIAAGIDVVDYGVAPTPVLAALTRLGDFAAGVMLTASHNPPEYNGIKLFGSDGVGLSRSQERSIEWLCNRRKFNSGRGSSTPDDSALERYRASLPADLVHSALSAGVPLLLDPGNGAAAGFARALFESLGFPVSAVNDTQDGSFPGRGAEPSATTLGGTCETLRASGAQLAACFDGDADRVVFCDTGGFLGLDEMMAFVAQHRVLQTSRRVLATSVEAGLLPQYALEQVGGYVVRGKVGDVAVAHLTRELDAALGAENVGVYIFPEQGLYPDSFVAVLHVLGMLTEPDAARRFIAALPRMYLNKRKVNCPAALKASVMSGAAGALRKAIDTSGESMVNTTDGLRFEWPDAWVLVRPSGTEPVVRVTSESTDAVRADDLARAAADAVTRLVAGSALAPGSGGT
jgi:phosphomannomutase